MTEDFEKISKDIVWSEWKGYSGSVEFEKQLMNLIEENLRLAHERGRESMREEAAKIADNCMADDGWITVTNVASAIREIKP